MSSTTEQLDALVQLQDVDCLLKELKDPEVLSHEESLGFSVQDLEPLERIRKRLAQQVDDRLLQTYERMRGRFLRVVVPVQGRVCTGCRMSLPTSGAGQSNDPVTFKYCENCGRILYRS